MATVSGMTAEHSQVLALDGRRRRASDRLRFRVLPNGDVSVRLPGGAPVVIEATVADRYLTEIVRLSQRARLRSLGVNVDPPRKPERRHRQVCHRQRDGALAPMGGCRRTRGHEGQCRDADGNFTPAVCTHQGRGRTTIHDLAHPERSGLCCAHCNARTGPLP